MGYTTKRNYTTKEEREQMVIEKGNPKNSSLNKISEYLSQPNVKAFNSIVTDKGFSRLDTKKGRPTIFGSREECKEEVEGYFKLCYDYDMIPTIASMALYLGYSRDALYSHAANPMCDFSDVLKQAISTCQAYQEQPALEGRLSAPTYIFSAKNYFGMKDTQDISVSNGNQMQNSTSTMATIKEQIEMEQENRKMIE